MGITKEANQNAQDKRSFEEKVFVRFDALDARTQRLENPARRKTIEKYKTLAETVQSLAIACGVLIGGFWTLFTFNALQTSYKAEAEIRQLELATREQGVVNIAVNAGQVSIANDAGRYIKIGIQVQNTGNRNLMLEFPEYALTIAKVQTNEGGQLRREWYKFSPIPSLYPAKIHSHKLESNAFVEPVEKELVRAGQTIDYPCWFRVEEAGLYLVTFVGRLTGEDLGVTQQAFGEVRPISVGEHTFIVVN
jgi:hypothetical protein